MIVNSAKLMRELEAAGLAPLACGGDGRVVLVGGAMLEPDGTRDHADNFEVQAPQKDGEPAQAPRALVLPEIEALALARAVRDAHDPTPDPPPERRDEVRALALVLTLADKAPAWAVDLVGQIAGTP